MSTECRQRTVDLFESVTECGCAAKVPAQALADLLRGVEVPTSPAVLFDREGVTCRNGDQRFITAKGRGALPASTRTRENACPS